MDLIAALEAIVGDKHVVTGDELQQPTSYWNAEPARALAWVAPGSTAEVSAVLRVCHEHDQPVVTQGGLTNCVSAAESSQQEVILSTRRLDQIERIDPVQGIVTVGAGVVLQKLQEACLLQNVVFPLDLGARGSCTVGGNVATNAGGVNVLRYGMMRQLVLGMEVVLADGRVLSSMNEMLKNNSAYDLKQMFIGSEGTLGVVTRLVLRVFPKPLSKNTAMVALGSFDDVIALLTHTRQSLGSELSAFEVMWGQYYQRVTAAPGRHAPLPADYPFYVLIEGEGFAAAQDSARFESMLEHAYSAGIVADAVVAASERERQALWMVREEFDPVLKPDPCFLYDVSLPVPEMAQYVEQVDAALQRRWPGTELYALGHIADGNLHFFIRPDSESEDLHEQVNALVYEPLAPIGGAVSAEHGIGTEKLNWLSQSRSVEEIEVMRMLKQMMDPRGILNPGRVLPAHSLSGSVAPAIVVPD